MTHQTPSFVARHAPCQQRGMVLMIMLIIFVLGSAALLMNTFGSAALRIERDKKSSEALAQAKEALIARAVMDTTSPGSLPCPDLAGLGVAEIATDCSFYIGRLPWKTLGLPDLRDSNGEPLWYALSRNFRDDSTNNPINSDSVGDLTVSGNPSANQVIAIVFAPGASVSGQRRSNSQTMACTTTGNTIAENLCAVNYLEGSNFNLNSKTSLNKSFVANNTSTTFNDQLVYITRDNLLPPVEHRIAREVKQCLDDYAALPSLTNTSQAHKKYPWAVPVTDTSNYLAVRSTLLGRIPSKPARNWTTDYRINNMLSALEALQVAVNNCVATNNSSNRIALDNAGGGLENAAKSVRDNTTSPTISVTITDAAINAGNNAQDSGRCGDINNNPTSNNVQTKLNSTYSALQSAFPEYDPSMPTEWTPTCMPLSPLPVGYWNSWRSYIFYRPSNAYRPNGVGSCGADCLSVVGSGNANLGSGSYRAAVIVAGKNLKSSARTTSNIQDYLEGANSAVTSSNTLETYRLEEQAIKAVSDLVVCADGKGADPNSKCN